MPSPESIAVGEAISKYLAQGKNSMEIQQGLQKFLRWCGRERLMGSLTPPLVETYCEASGADSAKKLAPLKGFFDFARKSDWIDHNLAIHVKAKKRAAPAKQKSTAPVPVVRVTAGGLAEARAELAMLKDERVIVAEQIRHAMGDKDFRENAPLDAARDKQGHLEARIRELEHNIRYARVVEDGADIDGSAGSRARIGSKVLVQDLRFDRELAYTLVGRSEVDLRQGKISIESPVGQAFLNRAVGDTVAVKVPSGEQQKYKIVRIES